MIQIFSGSLFSLSDLDREIRVILYSKNIYTGMSVISYCITIYIFLPHAPLNTFNLLLSILNLLIFVVFLFNTLKKQTKLPTVDRDNRGGNRKEMNIFLYTTTGL